MIMRNKPDNEYTVKDLAEILDVSARTIKNWEKKGYIPKAGRNKWDWRVYDEEQKESIITTVREQNFFCDNRERKEGNNGLLIGSNSKHF